MTSSGVSKTQKMSFLDPILTFFNQSQKKLGKAVKNGKAQILVYFGRNWPPLWHHQGGTKTPKMSFLDPNRTFFNQSQWNFAQLLRMEKHKFWCILAEIDPLYDVIRGNKNPKNEFFGPKSDIFQPISMKFCTVVKNRKIQILVYFGRNWPLVWRHNGGWKCPKITFFDLNWPFSSQSQWNVLRM